MPLTLFGGPCQVPWDCTCLLSKTKLKTQLSGNEEGDSEDAEMDQGDGAWGAQHAVRESVQYQVFTQYPCTVGIEFYA